MKKARLIPLFFTRQMNVRERFEEQIERLHEYYGDVAEAAGSKVASRFRPMLMQFCSLS